jgi:hypothetical protein
MGESYAGIFEMVVGNAVVIYCIVYVSAYTIIIKNLLQITRGFLLNEISITG